MSQQSFPEPSFQSLHSSSDSDNSVRDRTDTSVGRIVSGLASPRDIIRNILSHDLNQSPLSRAGLLQTASLVAHSSSQNAVLHSQDDIRSHTMQLSDLPMSPNTPPPSMFSPQPEGRSSFTFPSAASDSIISSIAESRAPPSRASQHSQNSVHQISPRSFLVEESLTIRKTGSSPVFSPSGLTILLSGQQPDHGITLSPAVTGSPKTLTINHNKRPRSRYVTFNTTTESSALIRNVEVSGRFYTPDQHHPILPRPSTFTSRMRSWMTVKRFRSHLPVSGGYLLSTATRSLPAVMLGLLLNILDGVSYGLIVFPTTGIFADLGGIGVSMFILSTVIAQVVYSAGGSGFAGASGSMMIEVVPFFHIIANDLARKIGEDRYHEVIATTLAAYAFSSILTGLMFFILGTLKLGVLIGFFPRHILIGCIGGVGVFLILTGVSVSTRMEDADIDFTYKTFQYVFLNFHNLVLWLSAFILAALLRVITHKYHHQLIFPAYFIVILVVFYFVVLAVGMDLSRLRDAGWLFTTGGSHESWYKFYTMFDFKAIQWGPFCAMFPTQLALLFFNVLHPPLNVPALSLSLDLDVDTDKEILAHGFSNLLAGFLGTVPNYLVYVNTLLFYRVGGDNRIAGFLLAGATTLLLFVGTAPISYIPVILVGALIFVLGIDLMKEALWDTRNRVNKLEYITIVSIMVCMTLWNFVSGVLFGIIVSCIFFVFQNSQQKSIRALYTGEAAMSTVRRPSAHRAYLRTVSKQTTVLRLQGFLFFGTITHVEDTIRKLVDGPSWAQNPFRFLILDISLVYGVDMSASEAFVRLQRLLASKRIVLVFCGLPADSVTITSLRNVGLLDTDGVEYFSVYNDAMEWSENAYLETWVSSFKQTEPVPLPGRQSTDLEMMTLSVPSSPRRSQLHDARLQIFGGESAASVPSPSQGSVEPFNTLSKIFSSDPEFDPQQFRCLIPYLERLSIYDGVTLWKQGDIPDALYIIESGVLKASYRFAEHTPIIEEAMVAGTLAGELSGLSGLERNATVVVERRAVLWRLSRENLIKLGDENPVLAQMFTRLVMRAAKVDYDVLLSALATK